MSQFFEMVCTKNLVGGLPLNLPRMEYTHIYIYIGPSTILLLSSLPGFT